MLGPDELSSTLGSSLVLIFLQSKTAQQLRMGQVDELVDAVPSCSLVANGKRVVGKCELFGGLGG